ARRCGRVRCVVKILRALFQLPTLTLSLSLSLSLSLPFGFCSVMIYQFSAAASAVSSKETRTGPDAPSQPTGAADALGEGGCGVCMWWEGSEAAAPEH